MSADADFEQITVRDNEGEERYEARIGDELAIQEYARQPRRVSLIHTEVPPAL